MKKFEHALSVAKGAGSGHSGYHHFIGQRVSAVLLLLLSPVLMLWLLNQRPFEYALLVQHLASPWIAGLWALWLFAAAYHAQLGIQMLLEDYIKHLGWRYGLILSSYVLLAVSLFWAWAALVKILVNH